MKKTIIHIANTASIALMVVSSAVAAPTVTQKQKDIFVNGQTPISFQKISNQLSEVRNQQAIIQRQQSDLKRTDLLTTAVIDVGIDLFHPNLMQKISFDLDTSGTKIIGAGLDVLGGDNWASFQLIDPTLYLVGADGLENGLIKGAKENPLGILKQWNHDFVGLLSHNIQNDSVLQNSIFKNINVKNINLNGVLTLISKPFDPAEYKSNKKNNKLIEIQDWNMNLTEGLPEGLAALDLSLIKDGDQFNRILSKTLQDWTDFPKFQNSIRNIALYIRQTQMSSKDDSDTVMTFAMDKINTGLIFSEFGPRALDPIEKILSFLRSDAIINGETTVQPERQIIRFIQAYKEGLQVLLNDPSIPYNEQADLKELIESLPEIQKALLWMAEQRNLKDASTEILKWIPGKSSFYRRWLLRTRHPLLNDAGANHGSHVSGLISQQDERLRIFPIRVGLGYIYGPRSSQNEIIQQSLLDMKNWLNQRFIQKAIDDLFVDKMGVSLSKLANSDSWETKSDFLLKLMESQLLKRSAKGGMVPIAFVNDIKQSVQEIGRRKILIANLSLGGLDLPFDLDPLDNQAVKVNKAVGFLIQELGKQSIAKSIHDFAPHTIFLYAAGNETQWLGGGAMGNSPSDLSSDWLKPFENEKKGVIAPGNHLKNQVVVGSLNEVGKPSDYSNLILSGPYDMVFIRGENLLSSIPKNDIYESLAMNIIDSEFPYFKDTLMNRQKNYLADDYRFSVIREASPKFATAQQVIRSMSFSTKYLLSLQYHNPIGQMSGTSMATPALAGVLGKAIIEKALREGHDPNKVYGQPGYRPDEIIPEFMSTLEQKYMGRRQLSYRKAEIKKLTEKSMEENQLIKQLKQIKNMPAKVLCSKIFGS